MEAHNCISALKLKYLRQFSRYIPASQASKRGFCTKLSNKNLFKCFQKAVFCSFVEVQTAVRIFTCGDVEVRSNKEKYTIIRGLLFLIFLTALASICFYFFYQFLWKKRQNRNKAINSCFYVYNHFREKIKGCIVG